MMKREERCNNSTRGKDAREEEFSPTKIIPVRQLEFARKVLSIKQKILLDTIRKNSKTGYISSTGYIFRVFNIYTKLMLSIQINQETRVLYVINKKN